MVIDWAKILDYLLKESSDIITLSVVGLVVIILLWFINGLIPSKSPLRYIFSLLIYLGVFLSIISAAFWLLGQRFIAAVS